MKNSVTYLLFFLLSTVLFGQDINFKATAQKTEISVNERLFVQFILVSQESIQSDKPMELPDFDGLNHIGTSQVNKVQYVNGEITKLFGIEVVLVADREGEYTIGEAKVSINGKIYKTQPIKIKVSKGLKPKIEGGQRIQGAFLLTEVSNKNPYLNQETVIVVKAYARDYSIIQRLRNYQEPDFSDLITNYVSEKVANHEKQVLIDGRTFISKEIARYVVFPQKSGELKINPFSIDVLLSGYYGAETVTLSSEPILLNVRDLPEGRTQNFSGAIGEYVMNTHISKTQLKSEESINLEIEIVGSGNLNTLKMPNINLPEHIESYAKRRRENFEARPSGLRGKVVKSMILVPQYGGNYKIDPITFRYFDPNLSEYVTLTSEPIHLKVDGPKPPSKVDSTQIEQPLDDQQNLTSDTTTVDGSSIFTPNIEKLRNQMSETVTKSNFNWIWFIFGGIVLAVILFLLFNKSNKKKSDLTQKQIDKNFRRKIASELSQLKSLAKSNDKNNFLNIEENILTQIGMYYSNTQLSDFTEEKVAEILSHQYGDLAQKWKKLLINCKQSKYAIASEQLDLKKIYKEVESLWKSISK